MIGRTMIAACVAAALAACGGDAGDGAAPEKPKPEPEKKSSVHDTPETAFAEAKRAFGEKDYKALYGMFAPQHRGELMMGGMLMAGFSTLGNKEAETELEALMKRHGVEESKVKAQEADIEKILAGVKDRPGLFHDLFTFAEKHSKEGEGMSIVADKIEEVKITGDKATATMVKKDGTKTEGKFIREGGKWYIDPSREKK